MNEQNPATPAQNTAAAANASEPTATSAPEDPELSSALAVPVETLSPAEKRKRSALHIVFAILAFLVLAALALLLIKSLSSHE